MGNNINIGIIGMQKYSKGWEMTIYLGKWGYKLTRKGLEPQKFNIYADSWVNIIN